MVRYNFVLSQHEMMSVTAAEQDIQDKSRH